MSIAKREHVATELKEMQRLCRMIFGDKWAAQSEEFRVILRAHMKKTGTGIAEAGLAIAKIIESHGRDPTPFLGALCDEMESVGLERMVVP